MEYLKPSLERVGEVSAVVLGNQPTGDIVDREVGELPPDGFKPNDIAAGLDD